jgi:hypothetical protein
MAQAYEQLPYRLIEKTVEKGLYIFGYGSLGRM